MHLRIFRTFRSSRTLFAKKKDYYSILGVPHSASEPDIKKAYFALAKKYHPDVNKNPEAKDKFAEINTAYQTLSDSEKRKVYDSTGITGDEQEQMKNSGFDGSSFSGSNPFGGFQSGGSFQDIFGGFEEFFSRSGKTEASYKGQDISISLDITFLEAAKGVQKNVSFERKSTCGVCKGTRIKPGAKASNCTSCHGTGVNTFQKGPISFQTTCGICEGTGKVISSPCTSCSGEGYVNSRGTEAINIPAGVADGQNLRMTSKGHQSEAGGPQGDLFIKINVAPHPLFKRVGQDIISDVPISVAKATLGGSVEVETLYGSVSVVVEPGTCSGDHKKIQAHGVPFLPPNQGRKGDHIVNFKVKILKHLTERQRKLYEELAKEEK